jgi:hypothetical protein
MFQPGDGKRHLRSALSVNVLIALVTLPRIGLENINVP